MFTRKTMLLLVGAAVFATACESTKSTGTSSSTQQSNAAPQNGVVTNTNATVQVDPLSGVENRAQIKEPADETRFARPKPVRLITGFAENAREAPSGDAIALLDETEDVTEIARDARGDYYLVVYADPRDRVQRLAGWVYKDALEDTDWAVRDTSAPGGSPLAGMTAAKLGCARGEAHLRTDHDFCGKTCRVDDGCDKKSGERCDGLAFEVNERANAVSNAAYCVSSSLPSKTGARDTFPPK